MDVNKSMEVDGKRVVYLYLEDWQMRMVKDFLGFDCDGIEIPVVPPIVAMYAVHTHKHTIHKKMYLTDWQMRELRDEAGMTCEFIELTKDINFRYGVRTK
ncbi:MAG TPA: hypothetical protein VHT34_13560 [Clostridia bacterium]|nr:hypothetical protein [Clostridia bacterium]